MQLRIVALVISVVQVLCCSAFARGQVTDPETWARALVDSPFHANGDSDALVASWLDLVEKEPQHPLAEATLRMLQGTSTEDMTPVNARVLALDQAKFSLAAAAILNDMQSSTRVETTPRDKLGTWKRDDLYAGTLASASILGPLGEPYDGSFRTKLFSQPDFEHEHTSITRRAIHWRPLERLLAYSSIYLDSEVWPATGWAMLCFEFDIERGGPAWIDFDLSDAIGPTYLTTLSTWEGSWKQALPDPSWSYSINGAPETAVDYLPKQRKVSERTPVVLRTGRNRVMISFNVGSRLSIAMHVLQPDGLPWKGLVEASDHRELGTVVNATAPTQAVVTSESFLLGLPVRGPDAEVLLGWIESKESSPARGFERVRAAVSGTTDRDGLKAFLSRCIERASHFPATWRKTHSRKLVEQVIAHDESRVDMQIAMAAILAPEDKEEEAFAKLTKLVLMTPWSAEASLELAAIYPRLDLEVPAERALLEAMARAPKSSRVLQRLADMAHNNGQSMEALTHLQKLVDDGADLASLQALASAQAHLGFIDKALLNYRAAALIGGIWSQATLADYLISLERWDEADALLARVEQRFEASSHYSMKRADIALARNDKVAERVHLTEALNREPSNPVARERLRALLVPDEAYAMQQRYAIDAAAVCASFDPKKYDDSVVLVIDSKISYVFEDGAVADFIHERRLVKDLDGCESQVTQRPAGELIKLATIKANTGQELEPSNIDGEFIMPSLQPGDSIECIQRKFTAPPADGVVQLPVWNFASVSIPFQISRYVISIPKSLLLRMVSRNFTGTYQAIDEGTRIVHIFEAHDSPRLLLQPGSPPADWILPSVQFVMDQKPSEIAKELTDEVALAVRVTPEIEAAAGNATKGMTSQEEKARALYKFVNKLVDKRVPSDRSSAQCVLLSRQGNAAFLFAALLDAVGIQYDLVWSRGLAPDCDYAPDPRVLTAFRWMVGSPLVLVKPQGAAPAWCDLTQRTHGYGIKMDDAPLASAFSTKSATWFDMPDCALAMRPGQDCSISIELDGKRGAAFQMKWDFYGKQGFELQQIVREIPKADRKQICTQLATSILPGSDVETFEMPGLDDDGEGLSISLKGKVKSFFDQVGGQHACRLPIDPLALSERCSGEGERKYAFFQPYSTVMRNTVRFQLPLGWKLAEPFVDVREDFYGCSYSLTFEQNDEHAFTVRREFLMKPLLLTPAEHPALVAVSKRIDEAERMRLRFVQVEIK